MFWKFPTVLGTVWELHVNHPCTSLQVRFVPHLLHGNRFPVVFSFLRSGGWFSFLFLTTCCPLGLPSSIQAWPSLLPWPSPLLGLRPGRGFFYSPQLMEICIRSGKIMDLLYSLFAPLAQSIIGLKAWTGILLLPTTDGNMHIRSGKITNLLHSLLITCFM